jgi:arsenical pump membrane protein
VDGRALLRIAAAPVIAGAVLAFALDARARDAADQAQGPFLLVAGLLLLGLVADADGLFRWASARLLGVTTAPRRLLLVALLLVTIVTALLNLDTAVVFLTPILIGAARGLAVDEEPFLYGTVLMANASSLLLPGANLTNLLVLAGEPVGGATFAWRILPAALAAALVTAAGLLVLEGRKLAARPNLKGSGPVRTAANPQGSDPLAIGPGGPRVRPLGAIACAIAALLVLALPHPGIPVLAVGLVATAVRVRERRLDSAGAVEAVGPLALATLFALSVLLGLLARTWSGPTDLLATASAWQTTAVGALAAVGLNNLPAAVLLSAVPPPHPRALLLGLNLGPNLAVTGSLSSYLWFKAARASGVRPSARRFSALGVPLGLAAMAAGLLTIRLIGPS